MSGENRPAAAILPGVGLRMVLPGLAVVAVTYGLARFSYGLFMPEFRIAFHLDSGLLGLIAGGSYLGYCISIAISGLLCVHWGPRAVVALAGAIATGGMCLVAAAHSSVMLAVGVLIAGTSAGLASPPMGDAVQARVAGPRQGAANSWINSGTSLGILVSAGVTIVARDSWRAAWLSFAAVALIATLWCFFTLPGRSVAAELSRRKRQRDDNTRRGPTSWLTRESLPLLVSSCAMGLAGSVYWTFSRDLIVTSGRMSEGTSTGFWMVIGAAGFFGGLAGSLVHKWGLTAALRGCLIGFGASIALLALAPGALSPVVVSGTAFGACYILLTGIYLVWSVAVFPHQPSLGIALSFAMISVGQVIGNPLAGGLSTAFGAPTVFWIFGLLSCAAALIAPYRSPAPKQGAVPDPDTADLTR